MINILLAEDDESMRQFLYLALQKAGYKVTACEDGLAALAQLENPENKFDLLLADIVMPGMDGIELSHKAAQIFPQMKIMYITGFAAVAMGQRNPQAEHTRILQKPFHLNDLVKQVQELLTEKR